MGKRKAMLLILFPVVAAGGIAGWVSHARPSTPVSWRGLAYDGMTVAEWEDELQRFVFNVSHGPITRRRPGWQEWLGKAGVHVGRTEPHYSLVFGPDAEAVPVLIALLESTHPDVRRIAMMGLSLRSEHAAAAVPALLRELEDPNYDVATLAGHALETIDKAAARRAGVEWDSDGDLNLRNPDGTRRR